MFWGAKHMRETQALLAKSRTPSTVTNFEKAMRKFNAKAQSVWMYFLTPSVATGVLAPVMLICFFLQGAGLPGSGM